MLAKCISNENLQKIGKLLALLITNQSINEINKINQINFSYQYPKNKWFLPGQNFHVHKKCQLVDVVSGFLNDATSITRFFFEM